jgi:hypothetical protein
MDRPLGSNLPLGFNGLQDSKGDFPLDSKARVHN